MNNLIVNFSCSVLSCPNNFTHLCYDCQNHTQWCSTHALNHIIDTQHKNIKEKYLGLNTQAKRLLTINLLKCIENIKKIRQESIISTKNLHKRISSLSVTTLSKFTKLINCFKDFILEINKSEFFEAEYAEKINKCASLETNISNIDIGINDISKFYDNTNEKLESFNVKKSVNSPNVVSAQKLSYSCNSLMISSSYNNKVPSIPVDTNPKTPIKQFSNFKQVEIMFFCIVCNRKERATSFIFNCSCGHNSCAFCKKNPHPGIECIYSDYSYERPNCPICARNCFNLCDELKSSCDSGCKFCMVCLKHPSKHFISNCERIYNSINY